AAMIGWRRALPREGLLSFDVGAHTHQIASQWASHAPKSFHITNGWSSMGFGFAGAIAAELAPPHRVAAPGLRLAGRHCREARASRPAGGLPHRRRLLPDDLRRGRRGQAAR